MDTTKKWWQSKGVWGGVVTILALVGGYFGLNITEAAQNELVEQIVVLGAVVSSIVGLYGRVVANSKIGTGNSGDNSPNQGS